MKTIEKPEATPPGNVTKPVRRLLEKINDVTNEEKRHKKLSTDLQTEEEGLLKTSDLTNPQTFESISLLRRKRDLIPARLRAYAEELTKLEGELAEANLDLEAVHTLALQAVLNGIKEELTEALLKRFGPDFKDATPAALACHEHQSGLLSASRAAEQILPYSAAGRAICNQLNWLRNGNYISKNPSSKASELLRMVDEFAALAF